MHVRWLGVEETTRRKPTVRELAVQHEAAGQAIGAFTEPYHGGWLFERRGQRTPSAVR